MKKYLILALLTVLTACKKEAPKCNDDKVKNMVIDIVHSKFMEAVEEQYFPLSQRPYVSKEELASELEKIRQMVYREAPGMDRTKTDYRLENVRTADFNKDTGTYKCKGSIATYSKETGKQIGSVDVEYMSELVEGGKFYVSVRFYSTSSMSVS
jgi:hypothetical protein